MVYDGKPCTDFSALEQEFSTQGNITFVSTHESAKGAAHARNIGLRHVGGDIIAFLQDDTLPEKDWLARTFAFHTKHPQKEEALLGMVAWTPELSSDAFHQWLLGHGQFCFDQFSATDRPWRFFYTSNISLKRALIGKNLFSEDFRGWGFEDTEFGYRLHKRGMRLHFDPSVRVYHDHHQTMEDFLRRTRRAGKNALLFEKKHPEVRIVPRGVRRKLLEGAINASGILPGHNSPERMWWREWKSAWLEATQTADDRP